MLNAKKANVQHTLLLKRIEYGFRQDCECSEKENKAFQQMLQKGEQLPENVAQYRDA